MRVKLLFVRHGETADNARQVIQGHIDTPLNDRGIAQSEATRDALAQTKIDIAYTSDLVRAKRTAEIIMEPHVGSPLIVDARIKEKSLGALEGTIYYKPHPPEAMKTIEPMQTFLGRLLDFFDSLFPPKGSGKTSILPESDQEQFTVLIVSHGGPIKVLLPSLWKQRNVVWTPEADSAGQAQKFKVWNCSVSTVVMESPGTGSEDNKDLISGWTGTVTSFSDISHLESLPSTQVKDGTEADTAIDDADKAAAERQYAIDTAVQWHKP